MSPSARRTLKSVHSDEQQLLRDLLIRAREEAGLTQQKLAQRLKKHQSFVAKYEVGERRLDVIELIRICRAMGADPMPIFRALLKAIG